MVHASLVALFALPLPAAAESDASAGNSGTAQAATGAAAEEAPRPVQRKRVREARPAAPVQPTVAAPVPAAAPTGPVELAGAALVSAVLALGFGALSGAPPTPGMAAAIVAVLTLLLLLALIVALRLGRRARRQRPLGPPVAQPLRDLGPITIGLLGREGEAGPITALLVPLSQAARDEPTASAAQAPTAAGPAPRVPAGFDAAGFVAAAREHFLRLQQAWDDGDTAGMEAMMTAAMIGRVHGELERRQAERRRAEHTEILALDAELIGVKTVGAQWLASVRFRGRMRDLDATVALDSPDAFDEIWNFDCASPGDGRWLLAGIEPLHARPESA
ncbi:Tim44 domain-containing protein [Derxia lacustris]|uniref:Tim44 domain-containing protein n=1 Tax=Derxia lacustris TaxID=764842 RepID=UPI0015936377|nr:Tim44-like domain-containing protein [Derxia lacustris]